MPDRPAPLPLAVALRSVVTAAVQSQDRVGLLTAVLDRSGEAPTADGAHVVALPRPRRPFDHTPDAA